MSYYIQLAIVLLSFSFIFLRRRKKLNEPPLVPYKYPIIGHTFDYYKDTKKFINKCQAEYGDIFSLYVFGRIMTIVGKEFSPEIFRNHKDFSFTEGFQEFFPLYSFLGRPLEFFDNVAKIVQVNLSSGLSLYTERVQKQLVKAIDKMIGDGKVLKSPQKIFQFFIAKPIAATFVGDELSDDDELVNSFAYVSDDLGPLLTVPAFLNFIHPDLHRAAMIIKVRYFNPFKSHKEIIRKKLKPIVEERLNKMRKLGNDYIPPTDMLQRFIELFCENYTIDFEAIMDYMFFSLFVSVISTSVFLTFCLQEWINHPQYHKEILEEQVQIYENNENSYYTLEQIAEMKKLDSFVRETMRVNTSFLTLEHKTLPSCFTFSNGYQVPKGRIIYIRAQNIHFDEELQGQDANEFKAFRHNSSATRVEKSYLAFGSGRNACPGRFFAITEIKVALHHLLLRYNIREENNEKVIPVDNTVYRGPSEQGLVFEKREYNTRNI